MLPTLKMDKGAMSQGVQPLEAKKARKCILPYNLQRKKALQTHSRPDLPNRKIVNSCFKPLSL